MGTDDPNFAVDQLEYYQAIARRDTWIVRALLLSVACPCSVSICG